MNIAAIDIGSNGARLLIKSFDDNAPESSRIRKLLFIRIPLRLGKDVFALGKISASTEGNYAYVDVGGGSTEISLLHDGILAESHSFNVGTLRMLAGAVTQEERNAMCRMLEKYAEGCNFDIRYF